VGVWHGTCSNAGGSEPCGNAEADGQTRGAGDGATVAAELLKLPSLVGQLLPIRRRCHLGNTASWAAHALLHDHGRVWLPLWQRWRAHARKTLRASSKSANRFGALPRTVCRELLWPYATAPRLQPLPLVVDRVGSQAGSTRAGPAHQRLGPATLQRLHTQRRTRCPPQRVPVILAHCAPSHRAHCMCVRVPCWPQASCCRGVDC